MRTTIKQLVKLASLTIILSVTAVVASAQTTGTVTVNGSVANSAAIRWWSYTALNSEAGANAPNTQNSPLLFTLSMGDVSPANTSSYAGGTVKMILRSNAAYAVSAQVTASSGFGAAASGDITLSDIGFGVGNLTNSGVLVSGDPAANSIIAGSFGNDPSAASKNGDGVPAFATSLNNVSAATQVLSGPRISKAGSVNSPNNGLLVDTVYAVGPQFFTPTTFSATVTYTITTP
ncbi:MAG: hypothetical protein AABN33_06590 [Acidobacteriota bacterium]